MGIQHHIVYLVLLASVRPYVRFAQCADYMMPMINRACLIVDCWWEPHCCYCYYIDGYHQMREFPRNKRKWKTWFVFYRFNSSFQYFYSLSLSIYLSIEWVQCCQKPKVSQTIAYIVCVHFLAFAIIMNNVVLFSEENFLHCFAKGIERTKFRTSEQRKTNDNLNACEQNMHS